MREVLKAIYFTLLSLGFDPLKLIDLFRGMPFYLRDYFNLKKRTTNKDFPLGKPYPILGERFKESGSLDPIYFNQDLFVAKRVFINNPGKHIDIGSRIDGFVAHLAAFREVEVFDIRPLSNLDKNIIFRQADLMNLPPDLKNSCESVSSLHAIEHFGLGRYSDPIDPDGHIKAINNIHSMLKNGGKFYFSVPIGEQRIEFNAHRIFSIAYLLKLFENKFTVDQFSYISDKGLFVENVVLTEEQIKDNCTCKNYGCGIFELSCLK